MQCINFKTVNYSCFYRQQHPYTSVALTLPSVIFTLIFILRKFPLPVQTLTRWFPRLG